MKHRDNWANYPDVQENQRFALQRKREFCTLRLFLNGSMESYSIIN
jgi:hypothetical protein